MTAEVRETIRALVVASDWPEVADRLIAVAGEPDHVDEAEAIVSELLSVGSLEGLRVELADREDLPLLVRIVLVDAAARVASCEPDDVQSLFIEVSARGRADWRLLVSAISADFHLWRGDLNGVVVAQAALIGAEGEDRRPLFAIARGRLRRLLALATLLGGFGMRKEAEDMAAVAMADFERAGCDEELLITRGLMDTVLVIMEGNSEEVLPQMKAVVQELDELGPDRVVLGWAALGWVAGMYLDFATVEQCLDALKKAPVNVVWPVLRHFVGLVRAVADLRRGGPTPAVCETVLEEFRQLHGSMVAGPTAALYVAGVLLDAGAATTARSVMAIAGTPDSSIDTVTRQSQREIELRIQLQTEPSPEVIAELIQITEEREALGQGWWGGETLLRCAWDCRHLGLNAEADAMAARGEELLPPSADRSAWQHELTARLRPAAS